MRTHLKTVLIVLCTLAVGGAATAGAATLLSGSKIKKHSIPFNRLSKGTQKKINKKNSVSGQTLIPGPTGPTGPKGDKGDRGTAGTNGTATYSGPKWGLIDRNTIGSPVGALRSGPYSGDGTGTGAPPLGSGSLGFSVKDNTEKVAFGNQVDFAGRKITDIDEMGFSVYQTGENADIAQDNLPNIAIEVDPTGAADTTAPNYSSLVFAPSGAGVIDNQWNAIDATTSGTWYFTNSATAMATGCSLAAQCAFTAMQAAVTANYPDMAVSFSFAVAKGRDRAFNGAIDALRYNDSVYDFEPFGVITQPAP